MTHVDISGRCTVTTSDVGKPVVGSTGRPVGEVDHVYESGAFALRCESAPAPEWSPAIESEDPANDTVVLRPEAVGLVTGDRVWLQI